MNTIILCAILFIATLFPLVFPVLSHAEAQYVWSGKLLDGTIITRDDLQKILHDHKQWVDSQGRHGKQADLTGVDLSFSNLDDIYLGWAKLSKTIFLGGNYKNADFTNADLSGASFTAVNIKHSYFKDADVSGAKFMGCDLSNAHFDNANLSSTLLMTSDFTGAYMVGANMSKSIQLQVNFTNANLSRTNLSGAKFLHSNFTKSDLTFSSARSSFFKQCIMNDAMISEIDLDSATYDSIISSPAKEFLGGINGLSTLKTSSPDGYYGIVLLRSALKDVGLRDLEREATYSVEMAKLRNKNYFEKTFGLIFFDLPSAYGMHPFRSILILIIGVFLFSGFYMYAIYKSDATNCIYKTWPEERVRKNLGTKKPEILSGNKYTTLKWAFYFSVLSASRIGWRDLNLGSWIVNTQCEEYLLKATGWVRTVSGIQSIISVYLLALWVLTYFGRPFE